MRTVFFYVIFICKNPPFTDSNLPVYDFTLQTASSPKIQIDDKTHRLIYNASAYEQEPDSKLKSFLQFVCSGTSEDDFTDHLADLVKKLKENEANKTEYGNMNLHDRDIKMAGKREGILEGTHLASIESAKNLIKMNLGTLEQISQAVNLPLDEVKAFLKNR